MHADRVSDLDHRHWFKKRRSLVEEVTLPFHNLVRDVGNRLLPLMDRLDQEFSAPDLVTNVVLHFASVMVLRHDVFVSVTDAQMRDLFAV